VSNPVVTLIGSRQAGKATLARSLQDYDYVKLEASENRECATEDPKAFFTAYLHKVILDEIQRIPELLSYIQLQC